MLIPYLVISVLLAIEHNNINQIAEFVLYPEKSLWFLWVLFFIIVVHQCGFGICEYFRVSEVLIQVSLAVILFVAGWKIHIFGLPIIAKYFVYYVIAYYTAPYIMKLPTGKMMSACAIALMLAFAVIGFGVLIPSQPIFLFVKEACPLWLLKGYKIGVALLAICAFIIVFRQFMDKPMTVVSKLGAYDTLGIYALHTLLLNLPVLLVLLHGALPSTAPYYWVGVLVVSIVILAMCEAMIMLCRKNKYLSLIFLGENKIYKSR